MRYRLRTLLIAGAIGPLLLVGLYWLGIAIYVNYRIATERGAFRFVDRTEKASPMP